MIGVDIYRYQTVTDWQRFAANVAYAWVKLTDGNGPAVVRGDKQVNGCKAVGVPVGGYHYAQFGDPVHQANVFLGEVRRLGATDLAPALDLEDPFTPGSTARSFGEAFCRAVADAGFRPAVYMSASMAGKVRPDQWNIPGLIIWIAAYGGNDGARSEADITRYYPGRYDVHQFTSRGTVPGVSGVVDLNWSVGVPFNHGEDDDMAGEGANILATVLTGGDSTRGIGMGPDGKMVYPRGVDPTSIIGRVADMQWAMTKALPVLIAHAQSGEEVDTGTIDAVVAAAVSAAVTAATNTVLVPALKEALGEDADVTAIAEATSVRIRSDLAAALASGAAPAPEHAE